MTSVTMKDRIRQVLESLKMNQGEFAQYIEISPALLSSVFNERTRPTLNLVEAIKKQIPELSTDWLIFGEGEMYKERKTVETAVSQQPQSESEMSIDFNEKTQKPPKYTVPRKDNRTVLFRDTTPKERPNETSVKPLNTTIMPEIPQKEEKYKGHLQRNIVEIRVFFDDRTYESFVSTKSKL